MIIRESIEIYREDTSIKKFKNEIELIKSTGYKIFKESDDYVCFLQSITVDDSNLFHNKNYK
jgi:hypothetical protein